MKLTINGQAYEFENGMNALDIAGEIDRDLKKNALVARINGRLISLPEPISEDGTLEIVDFSDADGRWTLRHTASHVLAQAVKNLKPDVKLAIGPAIDTGFYYDFDSSEPFTPEFRQQPWRKFLEETLIRDCGAVHLVAGHDYHFGFKGEGNPQKLQEAC